MTDRARRLIVCGGLGQFGGLVISGLRAAGLRPLIAGRRAPAELRLDVEDRDALRAGLRPGDLIVDAAGPYQTRSTALVEAAIDVGCDVVDLGDSLAHAERQLRLAAAIAEAGIRVFPGCSTVSAVAAAVIEASGIERPEVVAGLLVPAARHTARLATTRSLLASIGRPVRIWRDGLVRVRGWQRAPGVRLPRLGWRQGRLFESADALWLPRRWPSLRAVSLCVDPNVPGLARVLDLASREPLLPRLMSLGAPLGLGLVRRVAGTDGGLAYAIEGDGRRRLVEVAGGGEPALAAVIPAVEMVRRMVRDGPGAPGLVPPGRQLPTCALLEALAAAGITCRWMNIG